MDILLMLGGVAVFLYGMKQMSAGLEQGAGAGIRKLFKRIDKNSMINYGVGVGVTAIVQSSSATSVMTVGLANAGIVNVKQGAGIMLGAKVGTTFNAFLVVLGLINKGGFSFGVLFASAAFVGIIITYISNKDSLNKLALFLIGFGMLFVGLEVMGIALGANDSILGEKIQEMLLFRVMQQPVMLVLTGVILTCIIQSSTAAIFVFLSLLSKGMIPGLDQAFFLMMGANIGTCVDGLMASIGTNADAKRVAIFHLLTSTIGAVVFSIILAVLRTPVTLLFDSLQDAPTGLALYNLSYNLIYTLLLLPLLGPLVRLVTKMVKDKRTPVD